MFTQLAARQSSAPFGFAVPPDPGEFIGSLAAGDGDGLLRLLLADRWAGLGARVP